MPVPDFRDRRSSSFRFGARRSFLLFALTVACGACGARGGSSKRPPVRRVEVPARGSVPAPPPSAAPPPPSLLADLAREPSIRIGLSTSAAVVRLTSSRPFRIGAGTIWLETPEVLVRPERAPAAEASGGWLHRVELASFASESAAAEFRARTASELSDRDLETVVARDEQNGRYSVRVGAFPTESGAAVTAGELVRLGFDSARVIREPSTSGQVTALSLVAPGVAPVRVDALEIAAVPASRGAFVEVDSRPYRGFLRIAVNGANALTVTNVVHLEDYLKGVVPAELSPEAFPEKEALKAQAIAARTYAFKRMGQFDTEGYDLCATPACQVYRGVAVERRLSNAAVEETAGEVLLYQGRPVDALYTSTCGGRTEDSANVFSTSEPYLVGRACALESRGLSAESRNPGALSLESAALHRIGILDAPSEEGTAGHDETRGWIERAVAYLGQSPCWSAPSGSPPAALDLPALADLISQALCWERRLPFLLSPLDAERIAGPDLPEADRVRLAEALREGLLVLEGAGVRPGRALSRREVIASLYRLVTQRGEPILREGRLRAIERERLSIVEEDETGAEREVSMSLAPQRYLYREISGATSYVDRMALLPNDRVRYHAGDDGIDLLVVAISGASFDRSSRFSHWTVRKSASELTREVNLHSAVGEVLELRPMRYGSSGRLAELEVVGSAGRATFKGLAIRRALGIRENLFFFDPQYEPDGTIRGWVFTGRGWGHGVGLCQVGAYGMAAAGFSYRDILAHYYPGTEIDKISGRS